MLSFCNSCKKKVEPVANGASGKSVCADCGAEISMSSVDQLPRGAVINGFMVEDKLGQGGMGVVYKAKQLNLERYVALKVLSDELARDAEFVERFFKEARAAASLNHTNIVQVYDAGSTSDGIYYFAMELIEGETLDTKISRDGLLPQKDALEIAIKIASALDYAWEKQRLCHGDIKPDNIILNSSECAKLADLGLAKSIHDENDFKEGIMATPLYAPPEVISGDIHRIDFRSDMYSFGATLYHILSGMPPFPGDDPETVMRKHMNDAPIPLSEVNRELNPAISNLVDRLLLKNPENRPASWKEVCKTLDKIHDVERKVFHKPIQNTPKLSNVQPSASSGKQEPTAEPLLKIIVILASTAIILIVLTIAVYIYMDAKNRKGSVAVKQGIRSSTSSPAEKHQEEWLKVKADIAKTDPETGIGLIREYVRHYPSNTPPDADMLLQELRQKLISIQKAREDAKNRTEAIRKDVAELAASIAASDFKSMGKQTLEEFSKRIEQNLVAVSKNTEVSLSPESRNELNQAFLEISDILLKMKTEEEKALAEQAEKGKERIEQEKRGKAEEEKKRQGEEEKKRQDKLLTDNLLDGYYLLLDDFVSSYPKKKDPAYLKTIVETWLAENKNSTIPESLTANCAFLLDTVIPGEPLIFSV
ncbi:MAG: protein kinase, partial [Lentisphaerae bacterium]|nr:protein kinase [Lentisphaerota bacterium]